MLRYFFIVVVVGLLFNEFFAFRVPLDVAVVNTVCGKSVRRYGSLYTHELIMNFTKDTLAHSEWDVRMAFIDFPLPQSNKPSRNLLSFAAGTNFESIDQSIRRELDAMAGIEEDLCRITQDDVVNRQFTIAIDKIQAIQGNRQDAVDVMMWFIQTPYYNNLPNLTFRTLERYSMTFPTDDRILMLMVYLGEINKNEFWRFVDYGKAAKGEFENRKWKDAGYGPRGMTNFDFLGNPFACSLDKYVCFFDSASKCRSDVAFTAANDASTVCGLVPGVQNSECKEGKPTCDARCKAKEPKEYQKCSVTRGDGGTVQARPKLIENDRYYANCPWYTVPCPAMPSCSGRPPGSRRPQPPGTGRKPGVTDPDGDLETEIGRTRDEDEPTPVGRATTPSSGMETWAIVVIVMTVLLAMLIIVVVIVCYVKRRDRRQLERHHRRGQRPPPARPRHDPRRQGHSTTSGSSVIRSTRHPRPRPARHRR